MTRLGARDASPLPRRCLYWPPSRPRARAAARRRGGARESTRWRRGACEEEFGLEMRSNSKTSTHIFRAHYMSTQLSATFMNILA
eukprot:3878011-Prymnesium_polylepis.1